MDNREELLPVVDNEGNITGQTTRAEAHGGSRKLHPVVHLHVFNAQGQLYLQKRPEWKDIQPGKWDTATGGHVALGETIEQALRREVAEELGITEYAPEPLGSYIFESDRERELIYAYKTVYDKPLCPSPDELDGGRHWTKEEIEAAMGKGIFTPNFEGEYKRYFLL